MEIKLVRENQAAAQFSLRSIFVTTSAVGVALGALKWLGPFYMILVVQCEAVAAVLAMSKGTAWRGVVGAGLPVAFYFLILAFSNLDDNEWLLPYFVFWTSLAAWIGGGLTASEPTKDRSIFLRWSLLLQFAWLLIVCAIATDFFIQLFD